MTKAYAKALYTPKDNRAEFAQISPLKTILDIVSFVFVVESIIYQIFLCCALR